MLPNGLWVNIFHYLEVPATAIYVNNVFEKTWKKKKTKKIYARKRRFSTRCKCDGEGWWAEKKTRNDCHFWIFRLYLLFFLIFFYLHFTPTIRHPLFPWDAFTIVHRGTEYRKRAAATLHLPRGCARILLYFYPGEHH